MQTIDQGAVLGRSHWQRYELKYLVNETTAEELRRFCRDLLPPDGHGGTSIGASYPVASIYLDSPGGDLLRQTVNRSENRFKLRVRTYHDPGEAATSPHAYLEIKRKVRGVVHKTRAAVGSDFARQALCGDGDVRETLADLDQQSEGEAIEFLDLCRQIGARPAVGVFYNREAYEDDGVSGVRITMDRNLRAGVLPSWDAPEAELWWPVEMPGVIFEVKFTNTCPFWVTEMLHRMELMRRGICKYALCCRTAGALHHQSFFPAMDARWAF